MLENLRKELLNKEMNFVELDNYMMDQGFYSVYDDGITADIKQDKNVIYTFIDVDAAGVDNGIQVKIDFEITIDNGEDEVEEAFYLKVNEVEEF